MKETPELPEVIDARNDLALLRARRAAEQAAREARAAAWAEQAAKHVEHPQSRGSHRRMMSKP